MSIEEDFYPSITGKGLYARQLEGYWMDFGTRDRYFEASWDIIEGRIHTEVTRHSDGIFVAGDAEVDPTAEVGPRAVIGAGARVGPGARIINSVLLEGSEAGEGATIENSILGVGVKVAAGSTVGKEVLGKNEVDEVVNA